MILTNDNQKKIVDDLHAKIMERMAKAAPTDTSTTFATYYDSILDESKKSMLGEIKMAAAISDKVKNQSLKNFFQN